MAPRRDLGRAKSRPMAPASIESKTGRAHASNGRLRLVGVMPGLPNGRDYFFRPCRPPAFPGLPPGVVVVVVVVLLTETDRITDPQLPAASLALASSV